MPKTVIKITLDVVRMMISQTNKLPKFLNTIPKVRRSNASPNTKIQAKASIFYYYNFIGAAFNMLNWHIQ